MIWKVSANMWNSSFLLRSHSWINLILISFDNANGGGGGVYRKTQNANYAQQQWWCEF